MEKISTKHTIFFDASQNMSCINDSSVDLVVTSPPYPMIEMWDDIMSLQNPKIADELENNPQIAFELMHKELDLVWAECYRVIKDGGFLCINIGDATRTIKGKFQLFNNHSRIIQSCLNLGFTGLPNIIWRKQTNAPNKFMGSGMLPCGAYVTLEHEWILIFRKSNKRLYKKDKEKLERKQSAFFWEERNVWFSDVWDIKGTKQKIADSQTRERSASFPLELPYRLINMYSQQGDVVLDPFAGLGTTTVACILTQRNSIGFEIDGNLSNSIIQHIESYKVSDFNSLLRKRYNNHLSFVKSRIAEGKVFKHYNNNLSCEVMTSQETDIDFCLLDSVETEFDTKLRFNALYQKGGNLGNI